MRLRNQQELDKACETVESIYGFFIAAFTEADRKGHSAVSVISISLENGVLTLNKRKDTTIIILDYARGIREITVFKHTIERFI